MKSKGIPGLGLTHGPWVSRNSELVRVCPEWGPFPTQWGPARWVEIGTLVFLAAGMGLDASESLTILFTE